MPQTSGSHVDRLLKLTTFLMRALPGDSLEYYQGRLDHDLDKAAPDAPVHRIRALAYGAYTGGDFDLFHHRCTGGWSYIIRRRIEPSPADPFLAPKRRVVRR